MSDNPLQAQQTTVRVPAYGVEGFRGDWAVFDQNLINCYAEVVRNPTTGEGDVVVTKRGGFTRLGSIDLSTHCAVLGTTARAMAFMAVPTLYDVYIAAYYDSTFIRIICYRPQAGTSVLMGSIAVGNVSDKVYLSHGWTGNVAAPVTTIMVTWESGVGTASKGYYANAAGGTFAAASLTEITAAQSPWTRGKITRGPILQLNNQFYVATLDGVVYGTGTVLAPGTLPSAYVDRTVLTAGAEEGWVTSLAAVSSLVPDQYHCLVRYKHHLVACGKNTMQFLSDVGNAVGIVGIAIAPTEQAFIKFGVLDGYHVLNIDDVLYWVSMGVDDTLGVWRLDGYTPVKISNKKQDRELRDTRRTAAYQFNMFSLVTGSKRHIGITGMYAYGMAYTSESRFGGGSTTAGAVTYCRGDVGLYNIDDKTWWYLLNTNGDSPNIFTVTAVGNQYPPTSNPQNYTQRMLVVDYNATYGNTYIYAPQENTYADAIHSLAGGNSSYTMTVNMNTVMFDTEKRKRINKAKIIPVNNYAYGTTTYTDTGTLGLAYTAINVSDEQMNGGSFPKDRLQIRTMQIPNTYYRYYFNNLGSFRTLSMSVVEQSLRPFSLKCIELDVAQGTA